MKSRAHLVALGLLLGCGDSPAPCPPVPELWPAAGTSVPTLGSGTLVPLAEEQSLTIPQTHDYVEYTFKVGGVSYTARYSLSSNLPPYVYPFVFVQRPQPLSSCAALEGRGPVIDAIEVRRGGVPISTGERSHQSALKCPGQVLGKPSPLDGPPDGQGAALGAAEYFVWRLGGKVTLESGDEVVVTVLDAAGEPFEVFASSSESQALVKLGTLSGSGAVPMP